MSDLQVSAARRRTPLVLVVGTLSLFGLSGCSLPSGQADQTLLEGAVHTQQEVTSLLSNIPVEWLKSSTTDVPVSEYSFCESVIDTGPSGSAAWTFALGYDLVAPMSNAELRDLLAPSGDQWVLRPEATVSGVTTDSSVVNLFYDGQT